MLNEVDLRNFTGTGNWYKWSILFKNHLLTDGTKYVADEGGAYWLFDAIASHHAKAMRIPELRDFQIWRLEVKKDKKCVLTCWKDTGEGEKALITQRIPYTDFPLSSFECWVEPMGEDKYCILLPSEH